MPASADGDADALAETDGLKEVEGLTEADALILADTDGDKDVEGDTDADGDWDALGLTDAELETELDQDALALTEGDNEVEGETEAEAESDALMLGEIDVLGLIEADGDTSPQTVPEKRRYRLTVPVTVLRSAAGEAVTAVKVSSVVHELLSDECWMTPVNVPKLSVTWRYPTPPSADEVALSTTVSEIQS